MYTQDLLIKSDRDVRRARIDSVMGKVISISALLAVIPLFAVISLILIKALPFLTSDFFLNNPLDEHKGVLNAIIGSLQMSALTMVITSPIGIAGGIYLAEYASPRISEIGDTVLDILLGVPSIIAGLFAYLIVVPILGASGASGSIALSILTLPIIMRTTREVVRLVPTSLREASLALGVPVWRTTVLVTVRTALPGVLTGLVLAVSRSLGETAPLLMTAIGSNALNVLDFSAPMNAMTLVIFRYANSPSELEVGQAWATALVLMLIALALNISVRWRTIDARVS